MRGVIVRAKTSHGWNTIKKNYETTKNNIRLRAFFKQELRSEEQCLVIHGKEVFTKFWELNNWVSTISDGMKGLGCFDGIDYEVIPLE